MKKHLYLVFSVAFLFINTAVFGQNKLEKSKNELKSNSGSSSSSSHSSGSSRSSSDDDLGFLGSLFVDITWGVFKYGFIGDYKNENHLYSSLTPYPYYDGTSGNFADYDTDTISKKKLRIDLEDHFIYSNNDLYGNHLKAKIRPFQYFYLQTDYHQLYEFDKIANTSDNLSLFHFNLGYDRLRLNKFNLGWTLGASYVGNDVKKAGLSYGVNAEYFMGNHISFMGAAKWSQINTYPVNVYELQGKFHKKNYFLSLGLEHLKIATPTYNLIALGGGIYF